MTSLSAPSEDHVNQLRAIGIEAEHLVEAIGASNIERRICVANHAAKSGPGYYAYNGMLTSLSKQMANNSGWRRIDPLSMPLLINNALGVVLSVSSGDQFTGLQIAGHEPRSRNPKGQLTKELTRLNQITEVKGLFEAPEIPIRSVLEELKTTTFWLALVYFDKDVPEIRCEVSQPAGFNSRGQVDQYVRRIVIPPYPLEGNEFDGDDPNDGFGPITFDVPRR